MKSKKHEANTPTPAELIRLTRIAQEYYEQPSESRLTQRQIAEKLGMTQTEVSRSLQRAEELGIVCRTVKIDQKFIRNSATELQKTFPHLKDVIIVPTLVAAGEDVERDDEDMMVLNHYHLSQETRLVAKLGDAAARYFLKVVRPNDRIGLDGGITMEAFVQAFGRLSDQGRYDLPTACHLYPLMLLMSSDVVSVAPAALVSNLMRWLPSPSGYAFQFPDIEAPEERRRLLNNKTILRLREDIRQLDHYFLGIGFIDYKGEIQHAARRNRMATYAFNTLIWDAQKMGINVVALLKELGAVGDILYQTIDDQGNILKHPRIREYIERYCHCLNIERLQEIVTGGSVVEYDGQKNASNIVAIVGGKRKHQAAHATLRARLCNVLITDSLTAEYILDQERNPCHESLDAAAE